MNRGRSAARLGTRRSSDYLADSVLASIDGCVTTFAVAAGSVGGGLPANVAIILGFLLPVSGCGCGSAYGKGARLLAPVANLCECLAIVTVLQITCCFMAFMPEQWHNFWAQDQRFNTHNRVSIS